MASERRRSVGGVWEGRDGRSEPFVVERPVYLRHWYTRGVGFELERFEFEG